MGLAQLEIRSLPSRPPREKLYSGVPSPVLTLHFAFICVLSLSLPFSLSLPLSGSPSIAGIVQWPIASQHRVRQGLAFAYSSTPHSTGLTTSSVRRLVSATQHQQQHKPPPRTCIQTIHDDCCPLTRCGNQPGHADWTRVSLSLSLSLQLRRILHDIVVVPRSCYGCDNLHIRGAASYCIHTLVLVRRRWLLYPSKRPLQLLPSSPSPPRGCLNPFILFFLFIFSLLLFLLLFYLYSCLSAFSIYPATYLLTRWSSVPSLI